MAWHVLLFPSGVWVELDLSSKNNCLALRDGATLALASKPTGASHINKRGVSVVQDLSEAELAASLFSKRKGGKKHLSSLGYRQLLVVSGFVFSSQLQSTS